MLNWLSSIFCRLIQGVKATISYDCFALIIRELSSLQPHAVAGFALMLNV
ncbi:hypothetical protein SynNOUM97013_00730 [Synechococcus sp. NOUM97013]|nr:hypothetical protein SynNOUM97013_00730 [Synechococcus sp. NOUM97013]